MYWNCVCKGRKPFLNAQVVDGNATDGPSILCANSEGIVICSRKRAFVGLNMRGRNDA